MSDSTSTRSHAVRAARAEALADKARAKALRPWFKKTPVIVVVVVVAIVIVVSAVASAGAGGVDETAAASGLSVVAVGV
ncbi:MAG: hypothetical protein R6W83_02915 [Cryobacterium sp.]